MAATKKGVWDLQDVRDKQLASEWNYTGGAGLWGWGANTRGQLGLNDQVHRSSPTQIGTDMSWMTLGHGPLSWSAWQNFAIKSDGTLWSWGYNRFGQLGLNQSGSTSVFSSPCQVGTDTTWSFIAGGRNVVSAVKTDGTLWTWGNNENGRLGLNQAEPGLDYISSPAQVGTDTTWSTSTCNHSGVSAIKTDGSLWNWGKNDEGQLGLNEKTDRSSPTQVPGTTWVKVTSNTDNTLATKSDNTLWGWGLNDHGAIGVNKGGSVKYSSPAQVPGSWDPNSVSSGRATSGAVRTDGTLYTWGSGAYGSGGRNSTPSVSSPIQIGTGTDWKSAHMGYRSGGAMKTDGSIWLWGRNADDGNGVLGQNSTAQNLSSPVQVPGTWEKMDMHEQMVVAIR
tara:strand:- start:104 stop:1279 length:1176 start_codon:yes stop_codon:yes gene_type:complete